MGVDREHLRQSYDGNANTRATRPLPRWRVSARDEWISTLREAGARSIVDLGGGIGIDAQAFRVAGLEVRIVDLSPAHIEIARAAGLQAVVGDLVDSGLSENQVDAAWSASAFMHLGEGEFERALAEVERVVVPGGLVRVGLWGGVDEEVVWADDFQDPPRTFVHRSDERIIELVGQVFNDVAFWTEQSGFRPELHYQWVQARVRDT